jgi:EAL domain-containing protein (putative c-di-GMP-specific phosphodiesterase class I)
VQLILEETGLPANRLELELTETLVANEAALAVVDELRSLGIRVAVDDFGTGYSSLTLLKRLSCDMIKIDQSFVRGAAQTDPDRVILEAIIHMAQGLGVEVLAEGVETLEEMRALLERDCVLHQGYLFSKPVSRMEVEALGDLDAEWRIPIVDPDSWRPPAPVPDPAAVEAEAAREKKTAIGRLGFRSGSTPDPDADLYPALKDMG